MNPDFPRPRLGVSACLLGQPVRWDGGHQRDRFTAEVLAAHVDFVPLCPEAAIGLGVPRPPIRLVGELAAPLARGVKDAALEVSAPLRAYGAAQAAALGDGLSGYVFKKDSPSCGVFKVRVYGEDGQVRGHGRGLFADEFLKAQPWLPAEEDGRLNDAVLRENFMARVFTLARWLRDVQPAPTARALVDFHTTHKFMILAHGQTAYRELGRIVARAGAGDPAQAAADYLPPLMQTLARPALRRQHTNVLHHLLGFLKRGMSSGDKAELLQLIDRHRRGLVPLVAPLVLLRHHLLRAGNAYMARQHYLAPYPEDLMLRNHI